MKHVKRGVWGITLLALLLAPCAVVYAGGYNLAGVGAKALAMSGSFRGIADDYTAAFWNPAGLAGQERCLSVEGKFICPMIWVTPDVSEPYGYTGYNNVEQTTRAHQFPAGSIGFVYPMNDDLVFAIAGYAPTAIGVDFEGLFTGPPYGYTSNEAYPDDAWGSDLKVFDLHPSFGYRLNDNVRLGWGLILGYADITLRSPIVSPTGAPMPYEHIYGVGEMSGSSLGYGYNLGVLLDFEDNFHVGMSYRGEMTFHIDGSLDQTLYTPNAPGIYASLAASGDPMAALFLGNVLSASPDAEADFTIPMDFGIGFAYDISDQLTLAFDISWTNWSAIDDIIIEMDGNDATGAPAEDATLILRYEDTIRWNVGMNYKPMDNLDLYCGYYYDPCAIPDRSLRPSITDVALKHNVSIGAGYMVTENIMLQGYWEHLFSPERETRAMDADSDGDTDNLAANWKMQVDTFGITVGYRF